MKIIVIIPTYNERENIGKLIEALQTQFKKIDHKMHILIVDDNSPDGTATSVRQKMTKYANVHLLCGEKGGLGAAYIRGFDYAIRCLGANAIMEMDADFSHKPEDVPRLISGLDQGADFVIGSRYIQGGKIPDNWGLKRKMLSKWGNIFARYIAGLSRVRDCTAGFRAIGAHLLKKIDLTSLKVRGYAFQIALLNRAMVNNAVIKEIPVEFVDRVIGETKLGLSDIFEFIFNVWWIKLQNSTTLMKFLIVGGTGVFVNLGLFTLLINIGINKFVASPIAIEMSILSNFILNNCWTFGTRQTRDTFHLKAVKFNAVSLLALCVSYLSFVILSLLFPGVLPQIIQAFGIVPATLVNYILNSYWTFNEIDHVSVASKADAKFIEREI